MWTDILVAAAITAVFLVLAVVRPGLGRGMLGALFIGGSVFHVLYTLPNTPQSLVDLVSTAPIPPYREVIGYVVAWQFAPAFVIAVATFELATGLLILRRGSISRLGLVVAGAWCLGMLPVIPPDGAVVGVALTGTPGVAALLLARYHYRRSVFTVMPGHLRKWSGHKPLGDAPPCRIKSNAISSPTPKRF